MHDRTRILAAAAVASATLAAGSGAAIAAAASGQPTGSAGTISAREKPGSPSASKAAAKSAEERQGHDALAAAVAADLHLARSRVSAALRPIFAAGQADTSSPVLVAAARSLGVSPRQLTAALAHAKKSLAAGS